MEIPLRRREGWQTLFHALKGMGDINSVNIQSVSNVRTRPVKETLDTTPLVPRLVEEARYLRDIFENPEVRSVVDLESYDCPQDPPIPEWDLDG